MLHGITDIQTLGAGGRGAAPDRRRVRLRCCSPPGIIGTGMLAVPSSRAPPPTPWPSRSAGPSAWGSRLAEARGFYAILDGGDAGRRGARTSPASTPVQALIWSAVINGVIAVPIMAVMMLMAVRPEIMGRFTIKRQLKVLGWLATGIMAVAVVAMFYALYR